MVRIHLALTKSQKTSVSGLGSFKRSNRQTATKWGGGPYFEAHPKDIDLAATLPRMLHLQIAAAVGHTKTLCSESAPFGLPLQNKRLFCSDTPELGMCQNMVHRGTPKIWCFFWIPSEKSTHTHIKLKQLSLQRLFYCAGGRAQNKPALQC